MAGPERLVEDAERAGIERLCLAVGALVLVEPGEVAQI
jgi:hypothetical protein